MLQPIRGHGHFFPAFHLRSFSFFTAALHSDILIEFVDIHVILNYCSCRRVFGFHPDYSRCRFISHDEMPPKKRPAVAMIDAGAVDGPRPQRRRRAPQRPGNPPPDPEAFDDRLGVMEANQDGMLGQLDQMDDAIIGVNDRLDGVATVLEDIRTRLGGTALPSNPAPGAEPAVPSIPGQLPGIPPNFPPQGDVLSRWPWVDISTVQAIASGRFDIHDLPKLHCDEGLRTRFTARSIEGILQPFSGGVPQLVHRKSKLQSSFGDITTFLLAWTTYVSICTSYAPQRGPGFSS